MGEEEHARAAPRPPAGDADHDAAPGPPQPPKKRIRWRPSVWLTTLSTVVAVATGMFTLRDQIFSSSGGSADASVSGYQLAVGNVCSGLLEADNAAALNDGSLGLVQKGEVALAQRNAELNTFNSALRNSESLLAQFEGLRVPRRLITLERSAADAWNRIVTGQRAFVERLDAARDTRTLEAANEYLPALDDALDSDDLTRAITLAKLSADRCTLNAAAPAAVTPSKGGGRSKTFTPSVSGAASLPFTSNPQPVP
jgi:hypothetical protein